MQNLFLTIDKLMRGGFTRQEDLRQGRVEINLRTLIAAGLLLGAIYGGFMGLYGALRPQSPSALQLLATTAKVPLLFLLTLAVTFPSLYVFSTLAGSSLKFMETLRLLLIGIVINLALLASFGPVTGFFTLSTESYPFMIVLNVVFFAVGGAAGLIFMYRALRTVLGLKSDSADSDSIHPESKAKGIFYTWTLIYGVVGAQMGWILRPFIGAPDKAFELFRDRESNFFEAFIAVLKSLGG